eukprot:s1085_g14.t1
MFGKTKITLSQPTQKWKTVGLDSRHCTSLNTSSVSNATYWRTAHVVAQSIPGQMVDVLLHFFTSRRSKGSKPLWPNMQLLELNTKMFSPDTLEASFAQHSY